MKQKMLLHIGTALCLLIGTNCTNDTIYDETVSQNEAVLNLCAPNGEYIAKDMQDLKRQMSPILEVIYEENKDFEITKITYHPKDIGFCAEIDYVTSDGYSNNLIVQHHGSLKRIMDRSESTGESGKEWVSCVENESKKCSSCRLIENKTQIYCGCNKGKTEGCSLYVIKS